MDSTFTRKALRIVRELEGDHYNNPALPLVLPF